MVVSLAGNGGDAAAIAIVLAVEDEEEGEEEEQRDGDGGRRWKSRIAELRTLVGRVSSPAR
jgi:hypothetical protein